MKTRPVEAKSESNETRCWIENPHAQVLRVELSDGSFHLCPYSWLVWMRFSPQADTDTVTLIFNSHTVSITGKNLRELALAFQRMNVECVKVQPQHAGRPAISREPWSFTAFKSRKQKAGQSDVPGIQRTECQFVLSSRWLRVLFRSFFNEYHSSRYQLAIGVRTFATPLRCLKQCKWPIFTARFDAAKLRHGAYTTFDLLRQAGATGEPAPA